jgi:tetratricopeptide (TPR) repeat protein/class 3 adenylate cyclase
LIELSSVDPELLEQLLPAPLVWALRQPQPAAPAVAEACERLSAALALLIPFIPAPALDMQLAHPLRGGGRAAQITGSILLADPVDLAALSSQLALAGRQGDEEASTIVRRLFAALIEAIEEHGGRFMSMGGAMTAFFDTARLGSDHAAYACAAALQCQRRMADFAALDTSAGTFQLRLRAAVHSGQVFVVEVGDRSHIKQVVTGAALNRAVGAIDHAVPGEVIVSDATRQLLHDAQLQPKLTALYVLRDLPRLLAPPASPPTWRPGPPAPATLTALLERVGALRTYLPPELSPRFLRPQGEIGEFRRVTLLAGNFYAFGKLLSLLELVALVERDMGIVGRVLNTYYTRIQAVVQRYGGGIHTFDMATFGDRMVALFGAPTAHEDDPERAVRAALEIRTTVEDTNNEIATLLQSWTAEQSARRGLLRVTSVRLHQRLAVAGGVVFAGVVGTPQRREYMIAGEVAQIAARALTAASEGDLLLTSLAYRATRRLVEVEPLPPLVRQHSAKSIPLFRVLHERTAAAHLAATRPAATPLIGRQSELNQLLASAEAALRAGESAGGVIALIGEPGIGKSRLAEELVRSLNASLSEIELVWVECHSYEQTVPYVCIARALRQVLDLPVSQDRASQAAAVVRQVDLLTPGWSRFTPLLDSLLNLPIPPSALTTGLNVEQQRARLHDLIVQLCLSSGRRQPLVLAFDDLQWADASSLAIVERLAAELAGVPLLLLLLYRPVPDLPEPWRDLPHTSAVQLGALGRADSAGLVAALLGGHPSDELLPLIDRAQGTPLFLEETVRYMVDTEALRRDSSGIWKWAVPVSLNNVPAQIEQLITARLDRLDDETRALLQIASVIGQRFSRELLVLVSQQGDALGPRLDRLVQAALIVPDEGVVPAYRFKHALIHEIVYAGLLFAWRQALHEHVAAVIEVMYAGELGDYEALLAQHHLRAGHIDQAFPHLLRAAERAQSRSALSEALALYQQALAAAPWRDYRDEPMHVRDAIRLHENMGDVLALMGDYGAARAHYERLLDLLKLEKGADLNSRRAALQRKIGSTYENQGHLEPALSWLQRATSTVESAPEDVEAQIEQARILSDTGWVYFRQGDLDQAQQYLTRALALGEPHTVHDEQARILNRLGGIAYTRGDLALAQQYVELGLAASERSGNLVGQASALNNLGILTESRGHIDDSIRYGLQALEINERVGSRRELAITAINLGWAFYDHGQYERAVEYFALAIQNAAAVHDTYHHMLALLNLGRVQIAQERWDQATQSLEASHERAVQLNLPPIQLEAQIALAELALRQGHLEAALELYQQLLPLATEPESEEYGRFQRLEAQIAIVQGDQPRAIVLLETSAALFGRLHNMPEADRTRRLLAEVAPNAGGRPAPVMPAT